MRVVDEDGGPLAGASVRFDDVAPKPIGADGRLVTYRSARPARLSVALGDLRVAGGDVDEDGVFADSGFDIEVVMARPK